MATVEASIDVSQPVRTVYNQWTQFQEFPRFMEGVEQVVQLDNTHLHWVAEIAGAHREWSAEIVCQLPDERVAWRSTSGPANAGEVTFKCLDPESTRVTLRLGLRARRRGREGGRRAGHRVSPGGGRSRALPKLHRAPGQRDGGVTGRGGD